MSRASEIEPLTVFLTQDAAAQHARRTKRISARVSPARRSAYEAAAGVTGLSDWIVRACDEKLARDNTATKPTRKGRGS